MTRTKDPKEELIEHLPAMRAFALSLTRNSAAADDLVQDAVVKAWSNFDKFQQGTNMRAWLFTILRNSFYSHLRKRRREVEDVDGVHSGALFVEASQSEHIRMREFRHALGLLPEDQREALVLVGAAGYSYEETAEICGCAVGTIKSRVNRARRKLASLLDEDGANEREVAPIAVEEFAAAFR